MSLFAPSELLKITHNALRCVKMYSIGGSELLMAYVLGRYMSFLSAMKIFDFQWSDLEEQAVRVNKINKPSERPSGLLETRLFVTRNAPS